MSVEKVLLQRVLAKRQSPILIHNQVKQCVDVALRGGRGKGWTAEIAEIRKPTEMDDGRWKYLIGVKFSTTTDRNSVSEKIPDILTRLAESGSSGNLAATPYTIVVPDGYRDIAKLALDRRERSNEQRELSLEVKELGEVSLDPKNYFNDIYNLDAQIRRIMDAIKLGARTEWNNRKNTLLDGPPGCGKSSATMCFAKMLGKEGEAYAMFDATSMTKAGVIELLMESAFIPPVLFIEEIEKCEEQSLRWLLGIMDSRGRIQRTNYRVGNQARNVRMLVIATANNVRLLKTVMSGALYSRFQNKIYFPPPSRATLKLILARECQDIGGNEEWIEPTLDFAAKWGISDPRDVISILSCGGERLLTGEAQRDYELTMHPQEKIDLVKKMKQMKEFEEKDKEITAMVEKAHREKLAKENVEENARQSNE